MAASDAVIEIAGRRPVHVLSCGGTIAMTGQHARPELDAAGLLAGSDLSHVTTESLYNLPSSHLTLAQQLHICRRARDVAREGTGVVVTHGTDTLEDTAMLCDVLHDADAPIVFTGAIRSASSPGADGPANVVDAVSIAASPAAAGIGVVVVFGGEIHHARCVRKTDTTSLVPFSSPQTGPLGRVSEGHPTIWSRMPRNPPVDPPNLDKRVLIVSAMAGDDGTLARAALDAKPDGVVVTTLGAGHLPPFLLELWASVAAEIPVVACCRPERGVILNATYGYEGSERDLRATHLIPAGFLSPHAARMKLLACVSAGLDVTGVRAAFLQDDG